MGKFFNIGNSVGEQKRYRKEEIWRNNSKKWNSLKLCFLKSIPDLSIKDLMKTYLGLPKKLILFNTSKIQAN